MILQFQMLHFRFKDNRLVDLLGKWPTKPNSRPYPYSGLCYYLSPPEGLQSAIHDPLHLVLFVIIVLFLCTHMSKMWIRLSGSSGKDVCALM